VIASRSLACALLALTLNTFAAAAAGAERTVTVVPVEEKALALMLLVARGATQPVLLFDARDPAPTAAYPSADDRVECVHRDKTPAPLRKALTQVVPHDCVEVGDLSAYARELWPQATTAIVVDARRYSRLLNAAALAGISASALLPYEGGDPPDLAALQQWGIRHLVLGAGVPEPRGAAIGVEVTAVQGPREMATKVLESANRAAMDTIVVANPSDVDGVFSPSSLSLLSPLMATAHRVPLVLVGGASPDKVERDVLAVIDQLEIPVTHVVLVGDELALPSHRVPDPVFAAGGPEALGGAREVRVEIFSGLQREQSQDFAVGRIVAEDAARASIQLARQLHDPLPGGEEIVEFLSNADEVFDLGETISRTTVNEVRNAGIDVHAHFRDSVQPQVIKSALEDSTLMVWEGHARDLTLEEKGEIDIERAPAYVVLQGCYTLDRSDPFILMERGSRAIIATSAAIYSASGSAFARALFDSLVFARTDLGTAVRDARNYLLTLALVKRARGYKDWTKVYRAALAFALWGDPTLRPRLPEPQPAVPPVRWVRVPAGLLLEITPERLPEVEVGRYAARPRPRAMLGGLLLRKGDASERLVKEMFYTVQTDVAKARAVCAPEGWDVVSLYAPRTRSLTVLALPEWNDPDAEQPPGPFLFPVATAADTCGDGAAAAANDDSHD